MGLKPEGEVLRVKVNPSTDPLLKRVTVEAVKKWQSKPYPDRQGLDRSSFSRLTFEEAEREAGGEKADFFLNLLEQKIEGSEALFAAFVSLPTAYCLLPTF